MTFTGRELAGLIGSTFIAGVAFVLVLAGARLAWLPLAMFTLMVLWIVQAGRKDTPHG